MSLWRGFRSPDAWNHWYRHALPAYWIFLFSASHFPKLELGGPSSSDKFAHVVAFGLLAFLFWRFVETLRRPVGRGFVWTAAVWLIAYAALDEYLQQFVGRTTDSADFLANTSGIVCTLAILEWRRRSAAQPRQTPANPTDS